METEDDCHVQVLHVQRIRDRYLLWCCLRCQSPLPLHKTHQSRTANACAALRWYCYIDKALRVAILTRRFASQEYVLHRPYRGRACQHRSLDHRSSLVSFIPFAPQALGVLSAAFKPLNPLIPGAPSPPLKPFVPLSPRSSICAQRSLYS